MKPKKGRNKVLVIVAIILGLLFVIAAMSPAFATPLAKPLATAKLATPAVTQNIESETEEAANKTQDPASGENPDLEDADLDSNDPDSSDLDSNDPDSIDPDSSDRNGADSAGDNSAGNDSADTQGDTNDVDGVDPESTESGQEEGVAEDGFENAFESNNEEGIEEDAADDTGETDQVDETDEADETAEAATEALPRLLMQSSSVTPLTIKPGDGTKGLWHDTSNRRLGGADRFETATKISRDTHPDPQHVDTVIVATAFDFPDSLSAAPMGAKLNAPLLLTAPKSLAAETSNEIKRLKPTQIIIIGGTGAVTKNVENALKKLLPANGKIVRLGGADRYETSLAIAKHGWGKTDHAFVATGSNFPDALSAGAAAAALDAPVVLVPGLANHVAGPVKNFLQSSATKTVHIAGGTGVVNNTVANELKKVSTVKTVKRYHGADRFETSAQVAKQVFNGPRNTYWANGFEFPDALTGAAAAGAKGAALLLTAHDCVPSNIYDVNDSFSPADTIVLGGTGALKAQVQHGNECMIRPANTSDANWNGTKQLYAGLNQERFKQGQAAFRVADAKKGNPAYSWANKKDFKRNGSLKKQQPWVNFEAVVRAPVSGSNQVSYVVERLKSDTKTGARNMVYRSYGGSRPVVSVGYSSGTVGYATVYVGRYP